MFEKEIERVYLYGEQMGSIPGVCLDRENPAFCWED